MKKWMFCEGLELAGGRQGVPGRVDEIPYSTLAPAWLAPRLSEAATQIGLVPLRDDEDGGAYSTELADGTLERDPDMQWIRVTWPLSCDPGRLRRLLGLVEADARREIAARRSRSWASAMCHRVRQLAGR